MPITPPMLHLLLVVHAAATWFMCGLIWFVQVVHYPMLARLPAGDRPTLAATHANLTTLVVAPTMLIELATVVLLVLLPFVSGEGGVPVRSSLAWLGLGLLGLVWVSTFFIQVPLHAQLQGGSDAAATSLVNTNWIRTFAWSARGILAATLLIHALRAASASGGAS